MKKLCDMTEKEIRAEIFSDESPRERECVEELARRGAVSRAFNSPEVNHNNEER